MRYLIVTGTGRSGTNWLLDAFDASPATHCRNEPHGIPGSPLNRYPTLWNSDEGGSWQHHREHWDDVAQSSIRRFGVRDHHARHPKDYLNLAANHLGVGRLMAGPRARRLASYADHRLREQEWTLPWWAGSQGRLEDGVGVLKLRIDASFLSWLLAERPEVPVVHIMRRPGGRLHSWLTRLESTLDPSDRERHRVLRTTQVNRVRRADPRWGRLIPDPATLDLTRLELWFWRHANESVYEAGQGHARYARVGFDDLAADPVPTFERFYAHAGLEWTEEVARRVASDVSRSVWGPVPDSQEVAQAWRTGLDPAAVEAIDEVLDGSVLRGLLET